MPEIKQRLTPRALLELKIPNSPHLSPDGKRVVFCVTEADFEESRWVSRLWLADAAEGNARRITFSYEGERAPRWSPDGRWIAFLSTRPDMTEPPAQDEQEEEERAHREQVWILPAEGGEAQRMTNAKEGVRVFEWLPDGKTLLYLAPEVRPRPAQFARDDARKRKVDPVVEQEDKLRMQFWEVAVEDRKPHLLYTGDFGIAEFEIAPDGARLVFNSNRTGEANDYYDYDLYVLELNKDEEPRRLVERAGGKFQPVWSLDGARIAFLANLDPALSYSQECVWEIAAEGGEPVNLFADVPWDAYHLHWSRGDGTLYAAVADRTNGPLMRWTGEAWLPVTVPGETVECLDYDVSRESRVVSREDQPDTHDSRLATLSSPCWKTTRRRRNSTRSARTASDAR
jgi:dipeptidyl aminopeptidase/acylaminoacyl peptidase